MSTTQRLILEALLYQLESEWSEMLGNYGKLYQDPLPPCKKANPRLYALISNIRGELEHAEAVAADRADY